MSLFTARCLCGPRVRISDSRSPRRRAPPSARGRADPTGTMPLQRRWIADLDRRWRTVARMIPDAISLRANPTNMIQHSVLTGQDPIRAFQAWLDEALRQIVLGSNGSWILPYVRQATDMGAMDARQVQDAYSPDEPRDESGKWTTGLASGTWPGKKSEYDQDSGRVSHLASIVENAVKNDALPGLTAIKSSDNLYATQSWLSREEGGGDPVFPDVEKTLGKHPILVETRDGRRHILDGHHTIAYAMKNGQPFKALVFKENWQDAAPPDRTNLLQSLAITELQGIVEAVSQQLVRVFGDAAMTRTASSVTAGLARGIINKIGARRGHQLISFMCVRSFNASALDSYRAQGITHVGLVPEQRRGLLTRDADPPDPSLISKAYRAQGKLERALGGGVEVLTAGDDAVCLECQDISDGGPYTLDEAEGLIPAHPECRCKFVPADDERYADVTEDGVDDAFDPDQPRDKTGKWVTGGVELLSASGVAHHPEYVYHGTSSKNLDAVKHDGLRAGSYLATHPETALEEAERAVDGDPFSSARPGVGGHPVVLAVPKSSLTGHRFRVDPEYDDNTEDFGRAVITRSKIDPGSMQQLTSSQIRRHATKVTVKDSTTHVAAGVMIVAEDTGRTLFLKRSSTATDQPSVWALPAGAVEPGETIEQAAARETREEIGYEPDLDLLDQVHRQDWNGVDFTTFEHLVPREFRPHLDHEHDDYVWAHLESAPQPLHPGVLATLRAQDRDVADEGWNEELHPRDKEGKFTEANSFGNELAKHGIDANLTTSSVVHQISAAPVHSEKMAEIAKNHPQWTLKPAHTATYNAPISAFGKPTEQPLPAKTPDPTPPPEHPLQKHLQNVQGTTAERQAMRKQMKGLKYGDPLLKDLQSRHNASLWKQHVALTKQGKTDKAAEVASKLDKYSKSYGITNPLKSPPAQTASVTETKSFGKLGVTVAPLPVPPHALDFGTLKKVGEQKGSNPGGVYQSPHTGDQYYVKSMDEAHARNELLAAKLYALAGSRTLEYVPVKPDGATHYVATRYQDLDKSNVSALSPSERDQAQRDFATHAWLANWDAAGTGGDNQGVKGGITKTLDLGGALEYRAKGSPKGEAFGTHVNEFESLRDPNKNPDAAKLFGDMTDQKIRDSVAQRVGSITNQQIASTVTQNGGSIQLATKLIARKSDLIQRAADLGKAAVPKGPDLSTMNEEQVRVYYLKKQMGDHNAQSWISTAEKAMPKVAGTGLTPAEVAYIKAFTGPHSSVNEAMRLGVMDDHVFAFKHIMNDALAKLPPFEGDAVYRKINLTDSQRNLYEPGKIVHWQAFSSTSKDPNTWSGNTHFVIREPKSGVDVQKISSHPSEAEVIMPADTYYRVLSKKVIGTLGGGTTKIELEEVLPPGKKKKGTSNA